MRIKKLWRKIFSLFVIVLFTFSMNTPAIPQTTSGLVVGMTANQIMNKLRTAILDIIRELDQSVSVNSFQIRQHLMLLLSELENAALKLEGKLFSDLDKSQQEFFRNIEASIAEAQRSTTEPLEKLESISLNISTALERLPMVDGSPRILRISPSYVLKQNDNAGIRITIGGSCLNYGVPSLTFGNIECMLVGHTDVKIDFMCPASIFKESTSIIPVSGTLIVSEQKTMWDKFSSYFRYYEPKKIYRVLLQVVPPKLGTANLSIEYNESIEVFADRSGRIDAGNGHCEGGERKHGPFIFSVLGGPDWNIVPGSPQWGGEDTGNGGRQVLGPYDVTPKGFRFEVSLKNSGDCGPDLPWPLEGKAWMDARAWIGGFVNWREVCTVTTKKQSEITIGPLFWGQDKAISLPDNLSSFRLAVSQIDGKVPIVIAKDNSLRWFRVDIDGEKRTLLIRPRNLEEALK